MVKALEIEKQTGQGDQHKSVIPYAASIGVRVRDTHDLIERVERGFTYSAFKNLLGLLDLTSTELADLLQIPRRTLTRRKSDGRFAPDESERLLRISRVLDASVELFEGDREGAVRWLRSPNRALGGEVPLDMAKTEVGALEVERLIGRIEYGVPS
jgi:putative toxin-antitoxin system antitoxin component (TIGR02293 family)